MKERPLSPHLQIYRPALTMLMSIAHRASGGALYFGGALFVMWLWALAHYEAGFHMASRAIESPVGQILLFLFTWALFHHILGGARHLIWDAGRGFSPRMVEALAWGTLLGGLALNLALWFWAAWGGFA